MLVTFWGVRGTFPASGAAFARYGGDTMCIEVACGETTLILDAGSGLRALGARLDQKNGPIAAHIVLSHLHLDHVMGLPHFAPIWRRDARILLHAPQPCLDADEKALFSVLRPPLSPLDAGALPAAIGVQGFELGALFSPETGIIVRTVALNHQGACAGVAIDWRGRKLCYITDHEHGHAEADARLVKAVSGADLVIYDATFTDVEMAAHRGWGHSSWEQGVRLKQRAGVGLLALAHHHPDRTDLELDAFAEAASRRSANVFVARQGLSLRL